MLFVFGRADYVIRIILYIRVIRFIFSIPCHNYKYIVILIILLFYFINFYYIKFLLTNKYINAYYTYIHRFAILYNISFNILQNKINTRKPHYSKHL